MKNALRASFLILILVACSDFFPKKTTEGNNSEKPKGPSLPEKAVNDLRFCDYGKFNGSDLRQQFLWDLSTKSVCPKVREFRYHVTLLRLAGQQLCVGDENRSVEQDLNHHWFGVVSAYEYLVANPMEPLRANNGRLAMEIYAWPSANKYALNAELIKASQVGEAYTMNLAATRKGLTAIERLIFNKEATLQPGLSGNLRPDEQAFNSLPRDRRRQARCVVLSRMIQDVAIQAEDLYRQWDSAQGQYPRQMLRKIQSGALPMVLNEVSDGLFYLETVKDFKLGLPLGLNSRCLKENCADEVEHAASGAGTLSLRSNYEALRSALLGSATELGFLALVRNVGRTDLADKMEGMIRGIGQALSDVESTGDLRLQVLAVDKAKCTDMSSQISICRLFYAYKSFSTVYRSDFMAALNLNPPRTEADND